MPCEHPPHSARPDALSRRSFARSALGAAVLGWSSRPARAQQQGGGDTPLKVLIWTEGTAPKTVYPDGIDGALEEILRARPGVVATRARLEDDQAGLSDAALDAANVLVWWGRLRHDDVPDDRARAVEERVKGGQLGLLALHGSYASKPFRTLMGGPCEPGAWREDGRTERVAVAKPGHPIARGITDFTVPRSCMFAEPFAVPEPEDVVLMSSWDGGETLRSGLTWTIGRGRIAYLRQADDAFPVLFHPTVRLLVTNAASWVAGRP